jgi:hypothetical protein
MAEKKNDCGCGCALKHEVPKPAKDNGKAKEAKESK